MAAPWLISGQAGAEKAIQRSADPALVKALARAIRYQRLLDEGRYASVTEMVAGRGEQIKRGHFGTLLRPTLLALVSVEMVPAGPTARRIRAR